MKVFHPFDVMVVLTLLVGALPLGAVPNASLWIAIIVAATLRARHGSVPVRLLATGPDRRDRSN